MERKVRLIDANKIRYRDMSDGHVSNGVWYAFLDDIEKQPTVEAIPVEWIVNYYKFRVMPKSVEWFEAIEILLTDWEKENEEGTNNG